MGRCASWLKPPHVSEQLIVTSPALHQVGRSRTAGHRRNRFQHHSMNAGRARDFLQQADAPRKRPDQEEEFGGSFDLPPVGACDAGPSDPMVRLLVQASKVERVRFSVSKNGMLRAIMSAEALSLTGAFFTWTRVMQELCKMS